MCVMCPACAVSVCTHSLCEYTWPCAVVNPMGSHVSTAHMCWLVEPVSMCCEFTQYPAEHADLEHVDTGRVTSMTSLGLLVYPHLGSFSPLSPVNRVPENSREGLLNPGKIH